MVQSNHTNMKEFFFLEILFVVFLAVYVGTVLGNALIVVTITCGSHLHTDSTRRAIPGSEGPGLSQLLCIWYLERSDLYELLN